MPTLNVDKVFAEIDRFTPTSGANLVGVDAFELPGEDSVYLVGHFATVEEAEREKALRLADDPDEALHVVAASGT